MQESHCPKRIKLILIGSQQKMAKAGYFRLLVCPHHGRAAPSNDSSLCAANSMPRGKCECEFALPRVCVERITQPTGACLQFGMGELERRKRDEQRGHNLWKMGEGEAARKRGRRKRLKMDSHEGNWMSGEESSTLVSFCLMRACCH